MEAERRAAAAARLVIQHHWRSEVRAEGGGDWPGSFVGSYLSFQTRSGKVKGAVLLVRAGLICHDILSPHPSVNLLELSMLYILESVSVRCLFPHIFSLFPIPPYIHFI